MLNALATSSTILAASAMLGRLSDAGSVHSTAMRTSCTAEAPTAPSQSIPLPSQPPPMAPPPKPLHASFLCSLALALLRAGRLAAASHVASALPATAPSAALLRRLVPALASSGLAAAAARFRPVPALQGFDHVYAELLAGRYTATGNNAARASSFSPARSPPGILPRSGAAIWAKTLAWLAPMAHDTMRWQAERNFEQQQIVLKGNVLLLQTLYFADREKTEAVICELLVGLNYICRYEQQQNALLDCSSSIDFDDCMEWPLH